VSLRRRAESLLLALALAGAGLARADAGDAELQHTLDRIRASPREAGGFGDLAAWLFRHGELGRARAAAAEAVRLDPDSARHQRLLGYLAVADGASAEAERAFARAAELDPAARASLADFHLARAWAGYQETLRRSGPDRTVLERLREIAAATEVSPELKSMLRGGWPEGEASAREAAPPIHLADGVDTAVVVEKKTQTVRLYGREHGGVALLKTYPCTTGQAEGAKQERGDLKTPDGVYFFTDLLAGERLPTTYGSLALPLSYPNAWDRRAGRSGHGIWFHGTDRLASPFTPRDTQGCVLMRNEDLLELAGLVVPHTTPVLIAEEVPDRPVAEWQAIVSAVEHREGRAFAAIVAGPEYDLLLRGEGESISYDFVPHANDLRSALRESVAAAPGEWEARLRSLQPDYAASLRSVTVSSEDGSVAIETSAPVRPLVFRPELAQRLYIDLRGVRSSPAPEVYGGGGLVREVRVSSVAFQPPLTRVVIDLAREAHYEVAGEDQRIVVSVSETQAAEVTARQGTNAKLRRPVEVGVLR